MAFNNSDILHLLQKQSLPEVTNLLLEKAKYIEGTSLKYNTFYQKLKRISDTNKKLKKSKHTEEGRLYLDEYLQQPFEYPLTNIQSSEQSSESVKGIVKT